MKIETIKDLEAVLRLCRKQGVDSIKIDNVTIRLGDMPEPKVNAKSAAGQSEYIPTENVYSDEEILSWSVNG